MPRTPRPAARRPSLNRRGPAAPRLAAVLALPLAGALLASGCGTPPWEQAAASASPKAAASPTASPTPSPTPKPSAVVKPGRNDLASGSASHHLTAGAVDLTVNYWSTLQMNQWAPQAIKPLNLSLTGKFDAPASQKVYLDKATVVVTPHGPKGAMSSPSPLVDQATNKPGYVIRSPYSYMQVFQLPAVASDASSVNIAITYDILVQATPGSKDYARSTASDQLTVALT